MNSSEGRGVGIRIHNYDFDCLACRLTCQVFKGALDCLGFVKNRYDNGDVGFHGFFQQASVIGGAGASCAFRDIGMISTRFSGEGQSPCRM